MDYFFNILEQEKDKEERKNKINEKIRHLYMNKDVDSVHKIFNSKWESEIDLSYKEGVFLEFAGLLYPGKENNNIKEIKYLIEKIEEKNIDKNLFKTAMHNILLNAINFNNMSLIKYVIKEQTLVDIDFSYHDYCIVTNCLPKNNSLIKKDILNYFIIEGELRLNSDLEKILKKVKKTDVIDNLKKIDFYNQLNTKIGDNNSVIKRNKI